MKSSRRKSLAYSLALVVVLSGYQNCAQNVGFDTTPEELASQSFEQASSSMIMIDDNAPYVNLDKVTLKMESPRAVEMKISADRDCRDGVWQPYTSKLAWDLAQKNQVVAVYAQFKDLRGNISPCVNDDIMHDDQPPRLTFSGVSGAQTKNTSMNVTWTSRDDLSGIETTTCRDVNGIAVACTNALNLSATKEGRNEITVELRDRAKNESLAYRFHWTRDTVVPTVTINSKPAAVTGSNSATLTFSGTDAGTGIDKYMCRLGSAAFQACTSPFNLSGLSAGAQTFEVYSLDQVGNKSANAVANWTVDLSAPSIQFTQTPPVYDRSTTATFAFTGTDDGQPISNFECRMDNAAFAACSSPKSLTGLGNGRFQFEVRGIDSVGNRSAAVPFAWTVDTGLPVVNITSAPAALSNDTSASFAWTASDSLSGVKVVECSLDGGAYAACAGFAKTFTGLTQASHTLIVRATDNSGNHGSATKTWKVDTTAPTVTITSAPAPFVTPLNAQFAFVGNDANGISGYQCSVDSGAWVACSSPYTTPDLVPNGHSFFVRAFDSAGNVSAPASHSWVVDRSKPLIRVISATPSVPFGGTASVSFQVIDAESGLASVNCGLAGAMTTCPAVHTHQIPNLGSGSYTYTIDAVDKVGNPASESLTITVADRPLVCDPFSPAGEGLCDGGLVGDIFYLTGTARSTFVGSGTKSVDYFFTNGTQSTAALNLNRFAVTGRVFSQGFPLSDGSLLKDNNGGTLIEYFAFRMKTVAKLDPAINEPGWYQFATISDDGSRVGIKANGSTSYENIISNDGDHSARMGCTSEAIYIDDSTRLPMQVKYYQGPREHIAMVLMWRKVGSKTAAADAACGQTSTEHFFGPAPYSTPERYEYGRLLERGWQVMKKTNFIAPLN